MKTSETIGKIATALLQAQKAITFAAKDASNPFFKSKYADLPTVIDAVKPALNDAGIVFIQSATPSEAGTLSLTTRLIHESGEWIEDIATAPLQKNDPQGYGSAITYLRRYSLAAFTGLYQDDDDGQAASHPEKNKQLPKLTPGQAKAAYEEWIADKEAFVDNNGLADNDAITKCWFKRESNVRTAIKAWGDGLKNKEEAKEKFLDNITSYATNPNN